MLTFWLSNSQESAYLFEHWPVLSARGGGEGGVRGAGHQSAAHHWGHQADERGRFSQQQRRPSQGEACGPAFYIHFPAKLIFGPFRHFIP